MFLSDCLHWYPPPLMRNFWIKIAAPRRLPCPALPWQVAESLELKGCVLVSSQASITLLSLFVFYVQLCCAYASIVLPVLYRECGGALDR